MSTTTQPTITAVPPALEVPGPVARVPSLEEIERLTEVPDRRVVFRGVDWAFYEELVDSVPESSNIQVGYDGKDLEVMGKGRKHGKGTKLLGQLVEAIAQELGIPYSSLADTTWKRPEIARGLEADQCYYFLPEKIAADAAALERDSTEIADYPDPDLAIEVDISAPQIDRASIYAALHVTEVWRFDGNQVVIERLTPEGKYVSSDASGFLPVRADTIRRWVVEEDSRDESAWARRLRAEIKAQAIHAENES
jgi:Uma2 family endonuclease